MIYYATDVEQERDSLVGRRVNQTPLFFVARIISDRGVMLPGYEIKHEGPERNDGFANQFYHISMAINGSCRTEMEDGRSYVSKEFDQPNPLSGEYQVYPYGRCSTVTLTTFEWMNIRSDRQIQARYLRLLAGEFVFLEPNEIGVVCRGELLTNIAVCNPFDAFDPLEKIIVSDPNGAHIVAVSLREV